MLSEWSSCLFQLVHGYAAAAWGPPSTSAALWMMRGPAYYLHGGVWQCRSDQAARLLSLPQQARCEAGSRMSKANDLFVCDAINALCIFQL
jgi:hypothetical protein